MPIAILPGAKTKKILAALEGNWQAAMEGFHTYTAMADRDSDPVRARVFRRLAQAEMAIHGGGAVVFFVSVWLRAPNQISHGKLSRNERKRNLFDLVIGQMIGGYCSRQSALFLRRILVVG